MVLHAEGLLGGGHFIFMSGLAGDRSILWFFIPFIDSIRQGVLLLGEAFGWVEQGFCCCVT